MRVTSKPVEQGSRATTRKPQKYYRGTPEKVPPWVN